LYVDLSRSDRKNLGRDCDIVDVVDYDVVAVVPLVMIVALMLMIVALMEMIVALMVMIVALMVMIVALMMMTSKLNTLVVIVSMKGNRQIERFE
jgi:hypothetical protein